jgi:hypothetical protein
MDPDLEAMLRIYKTSSAKRREAKDALYQAEQDTLRLREEYTRHELLLKQLHPLIHAMQGGSQAMVDADREMRETVFESIRSTRTAPASTPVDPPMARAMPVPSTARSKASSSSSATDNPKS